MMSKKNQNFLFLAVCALNMIMFGLVIDTNGSPVRDFIQGLTVGLSAAAVFAMLWGMAKERRSRA
ncbi:hypothetical protein R70723_02425 [Paenibacillus sp. FSL R7-0273]|uniref:hypothetical protein n=1 Tax=Paenibacillus sp. FSL R7-0273 TaxID=1536772 RepID=UPI0004F8BE49|nr:hypothetical protein [Paenibacillus sp. FSL R7-0273]AIQ44885.1 hypothetical protein R70723_02425 [Paenibacillus sp. FSL R7-0273]OMF93261.1 hypothetical protein BK144_11115 [Paenibacillus sp. FSL R7-0273]